MTKQPEWKLVAQLGDASPIDYGGYFIYEDATGVYQPEAEILQEPSDDEWAQDDRDRYRMEHDLTIEYERTHPEANWKEAAEWVEQELSSKFESGLRWTVYRFILEPCTFINGILSDNKFHPDYAVWFQEGLNGLCDTMGVTELQFLADICGTDTCARANAWRCVGQYHGFENLDHDPLQLTKEEVKERYKEELKIKS